MAMKVTTFQVSDTLAANAIDAVCPFCVAHAGFVVNQVRTNGQAFHMTYRNRAMAEKRLAVVRATLPHAYVYPER